MLPPGFSVIEVIPDTQHRCMKIEAAGGERRFAKIFSDPAVCEREWRALSKLYCAAPRSFRIPRPIDCILTPDGGCLVLELVPGVTAREELLHGGVDARALCARLVAATAEIHALASADTADDAISAARERLHRLIDRDGAGVFTGREADEARRLAAPLFELLERFPFPCDSYKDANPANWLLSADGGLYAVDFESARALPFFVDFINIVEYAAGYLDERAKAELLDCYIAARRGLSPQWAMSLPDDATRLLHLWALFRHEEQMLHRIRDACAGGDRWHADAFLYHLDMARRHLAGAAAALPAEDARRLESALSSQLLLFEAAFRRFAPAATAMPSHFDAVALTAEGPRHIRMEMPDARESDSLALRISIAGVCRSDLREVAGTRTARGDFGHELVAVVASSAGVTPIAAGTLVCLDPHVPIRRTSGFGEWMIAAGPPGDLQRAFSVLPRDVPLRRLLFTEPTACAHHCVVKIREHLQRDSLDGLRIAVIGAGTAGVLIAWLARLSGGEVAVFNRSSERLSFLRTRRILPDEQLREMRLAPSSWDVVVCATERSTAAVIDAAAGAVRDRGMVLLYGATAAGDFFGEVDCDAVRRGERLRHTRNAGKTVLFGGSYGAAPADFVQSAGMLAGSEALPAERLIARSVRLEALPQLLRAYSSGEIPYIGKTVVEF